MKQLASWITKLAVTTVVQFVWYWLVVLALHLIFLDGPLPRGLVFRSVVFGITWLPTGILLLRVRAALTRRRRR